MSEEEVIQHVMNTFGAEDYSSFELEIDYVGEKKLNIIEQNKTSLAWRNLESPMLGFLL